MNGREHGAVEVRFVREAEKDVPMVPLRPLFTAIGWKVRYEDGADVRVIAPYRLEYQREDLDPDLRGKRDAPFLLIPLDSFLRTGESLVTSPQMNVGENPFARPLPMVVRGQLYVPLTYIEEAVAQVDGRIDVEGKDVDGRTYRTTKGIFAAFDEARPEIRIRYVPNVARGHS